MSDQISVKQIHSLQTLATGSKKASEKYIEETQQAHQSFQFRTNANEGTAIEAFVNKINNLSSQVFAVYPGLLSDFSTAISNYNTVLTGEGFSNKVYSDTSDIEAIKNWLYVQRKHSVVEKGEALDEAFKTASEALALSPSPVDINVNTSLIRQSAEESFATRRRVYHEKHTNLMQGKQTFSADLGTVQTGLERVKIYLNNALQLSQIDTQKLVDWVKDGILNVSHMDYRDYVRLGNDAKVLESLISKDDDNTKMEQIGNVDPKNISQAMMNHVYVKSYELLDDYKKTGNKDSLKALETFLVTITGNDHSDTYVDTYMTKLSAGGVIFSTAISGQATSVMPDVDNYKNDYARYMVDFNNAKAYIANELSPKMATAQSLSGLFDTIRLMGLGKKTEPPGIHFGNYKSGSTQTVKSGSLALDGDNFVFTTKRSETWAKPRNGFIQYETKNLKDEKVNANIYNNPESIQNAQMLKEIKDLKEEREQAVKDFWKGMAKTATGYVLPPGFDTVANMAIDASTIKKTEDYGGILADGTGLYNGKYSESVGITKDVLGHILDLNSELGRIDGDIEENKAKLYANVFGVGGVTYRTDNSETNGLYQPNYDLQSILYADDIEKNGMKGYAIREAAAQGQCNDGLNKAVDKFEYDVNHSTYSSSEKSFLMGTSRQSLADRGIEKVYDIFQRMDNHATNFGDYKYEDYHEKAINQFEPFEGS